MQMAREMCARKRKIADPDPRQPSLALSGPKRGAKIAIPRFPPGSCAKRTKLAAGTGKTPVPASGPINDCPRTPKSLECALGTGVVRKTAAGLLADRLRGHFPVYAPGSSCPLARLPCASRLRAGSTLSLPPSSVRPLDDYQGTGMCNGQYTTLVLQLCFRYIWAIGNGGRGNFLVDYGTNENLVYSVGEASVLTRDRTRRFLWSRSLPEEAFESVKTRLDAPMLAETVVRHLQYWLEAVFQGEFHRIWLEILPFADRLRLGSGQRASDRVRETTTARVRELIRFFSDRHWHQPPLCRE